MVSKLGGLFRRPRPESKFAAIFGLEDDDLDSLHPPKDLADVDGWDRYTVLQARIGFAPKLYDMMCDDSDLVRVMIAEGMTRVLCAGCGVSQEPRALAEAGFDVVALDFSPMAIEITEQLDFSPDLFATFCEPELRGERGHLECVVGNFLEPSVCPGPFDVIIERRTAQLFEREGLDRVMGALAARLVPDGIFLSHCHDGGWKPPVEPRHHTRPWFEENGWKIVMGTASRKPPGRVAWLKVSTG